MAARRAAGLLIALALGLATSCASKSGKFDPIGAIGAISEVSEEDERSLGAQVDAAIQEQVPMIDDPVVLGFVNELGQRIVAQIEPQPFIYRFRVIPNSTLNAFALPSGYIYFHSATILSAASLNELAGVMGHEIAHVKGRHYARGSEATFWPSLLARVAGIGAAVASGEPGFAAAAEGVNVALQLKYSRQFEAEADEMGAVFMARAGFDPAGMGRFFERIVAADVPSAIEIPPYLYSHPDLDQRISGVKARAATLRISGHFEPEFEARFRDAQAGSRSSSRSGERASRAARPSIARARIRFSRARTPPRRPAAPRRPSRRSTRRSGWSPPIRASRSARGRSSRSRAGRAKRSSRGCGRSRSTRAWRSPTTTSAARTSRSAIATMRPTGTSRRCAASSRAECSSSAPSSR